MIYPSNRYLTQLRQYAELEAKMNRDFSGPIKQITYLERDRLVAEGFNIVDAEEALNAVLTQEVQRFPVQIEVIPF